MYLNNDIIMILASIILIINTFFNEKEIKII